MSFLEKKLDHTDSEQDRVLNYPDYLEKVKQNKTHTTQRQAYGKEKLKQLNVAPHVQDAYIKLLGLDKTPQTPADLPTEISLPGELLPKFDKAIAATGQDDRERSQTIRLDKKGANVQGRVFKGDDTTSTKEARLKRFFSGRQRNNIIWYHTHPHKEEPFFSTQDAALHIANVPSAPINLVGGKSSIYALVRTAQSERDPSSGKITLDDIQTLKANLPSQGYDEYSPANSSRAVEQHGLGLYQARRIHDVSNPNDKTKQRPGDIVLNRIKPSANKKIPNK